MERCLQEFRVRGVKTNIPFLINLITHPDFLAGACDDAVPRRDAGAVPVSHAPGPRHEAASLHRARSSSTAIPKCGAVGDNHVASRRCARSRPCASHDRRLAARSHATSFKELGAAKFASWVREQKQLFITDTTMRDAHQSLFATRMRTCDMLAHRADAMPGQHADLFSLEMWGGATFDTSMRFLKESPWDRLADMRERVPNILFQMLLRAANAVGYTNYPDNVVEAFVKESAEAGIDVFRIFDSLNWLPNLKLGHRRGAQDRRHLRGGDLLHRRHPRPEARQVLR